MSITFLPAESSHSTSDSAKDETDPYSMACEPPSDREPDVPLMQNHSGPGAKSLTTSHGTPLTEANLAAHDWHCQSQSSGRRDSASVSSSSTFSQYFQDSHTASFEAANTVPPCKPGSRATRMTSLTGSLMQLMPWRRSENRSSRAYSAKSKLGYDKLPCEAKGRPER